MSREVVERRRLRAARSEGTYSKIGDVALVPRLSQLGSDVLDQLATDQVAGLADLACDHRFDVLGSGWVQVRHGMRCPGLEGHRYGPWAEVRADPDGLWLAGRIDTANLPEAKRVWRLVDPDYVPIDWHLDVRSGFRWHEAEHSTRVRTAVRPGVDIKVPWELARGQHLPQLAWAWALANRGTQGFRPPETYLREFRNQVLDFVATNPPAFGVNWACAMDVGLRVVSWLVAWDLFRAFGARFDDAFEARLGRSVHEHAQHILDHLEWNPGLRANHYLADIVGLAFAAAHLPASPQTDAWLAFAVRELVNETDLQFHPDGSNFEGSVCYHRLSTEMVLYATALTCGLGDRLAALERYDHRLVAAGPGLPPAPLPMYGSEPFPSEHFDRIQRAVGFTADVTKPDGRVVQVGDNDSGRCLKLLPAMRRITTAEARTTYANLSGYEDLPDDATWWDEDHLDHRHLLNAAAGLFDGDGGPEGAVVRALAGGRTIPVLPVSPPAFLPSGAIPEGGRISEFPVAAATEGREAIAYTGMGLFILRSDHLHLTVRCGEIGQRGNGGHAHNDQLSLTLWAHGADVVVDPGTYLYTPIPELRDRYRSVAAHFAPRVEGREPGRLDLGVFALGDDAQAECVRFGPDGFVGRHHGFGVPVYRIVTIEQDCVRVRDVADGDIDLHAPVHGIRISPGYGVLYADRWGPVTGDVPAVR